MLIVGAGPGRYESILPTVTLQNRLTLDHDDAQANRLFNQFCPHNETLGILQQPPVAYLTWQAGRGERDVTSRTKREDVEGPGHSAMLYKTIRSLLDVIEKIT